MVVHYCHIVGEECPSVDLVFEFLGCSRLTISLPNLGNTSTASFTEFTVSFPHENPCVCSGFSVAF